MDLVGSVQGVVLLVLALASLAMTGLAAVDSVRQPTSMFPAVGRQTKVFWVAILLVAVLLSIVTFPNALSLFNVLGVVAAGVYLADVRPKIKEISGGRGSSGPYGGY